MAKSPSPPIILVLWLQSTQIFIHKHKKNSNKVCVKRITARCCYMAIFCKHKASTHSIQSVVQEPVSRLPSFVPHSKELSFIVLKVTNLNFPHLALEMIIMWREQSIQCLWSLIRRQSTCPFPHITPQKSHAPLLPSQQPITGLAQIAIYLGSKSQSVLVVQ